MDLMHFSGFGRTTGTSGGMPVDLKLIYFNTQESPATFLHAAQTS